MSVLPDTAPGVTQDASRNSRVRFDFETDSTHPAPQTPAPHHGHVNEVVQNAPPVTIQPPSARVHQDRYFDGWTFEQARAATYRSTDAAVDPRRHQQVFGPRHAAHSMLTNRPGSEVLHGDHRRPVEALPVPMDSDRRDSDETLIDGQMNATIAGRRASRGATQSVVRCACAPAPDIANQRPLKPALRRSITDGDTKEGVDDEAANLVRAHIHRGEKGSIPCPHARPPVVPQPQNAYDWSYVDEEARATEHAPKKQGGVLSNLLKLDATNLRRTATSSSWASGVSVAPSRNPSTDTHEGFNRRRRFSNVSCRTDADDHDNEKDAAPPYDGQSNRPGLRRRASSSLSVAPWLKTNDAHHKEDVVSIKKQRKRTSRKLRRLSVTVHVADILIRHKFILKLAKALMTFGAPSHRIESELNAMADVLEVDGHFVHLPSIVIASFGDQDTRTSETHFVKAGGGLNLGCLTEVHEVYRSVAHDEVGVDVGLKQLTKLLNAPPIYGLWTRVAIAFVCAGTICMLGFSGSLIDGLVAAFFGGVLAFLQIRVASSNPMYSNIFEISIATLVSFVGRGLSTTDLFCYEAISSSGVVLILPGYVILCGSLELASRNLIAGSVKLVYSIIYSLFLGFGIAVGSDLYYLFDHRASIQAAASATPSDVIDSLGLLTFSNTTLPALNGTFTLTNTTAQIAASATKSAALQVGNVVCTRGADWQWWRQELNPYWAFLLVPVFSTALSLWNLQPVRDRQFPVMIFIAIVGYATNVLANAYIFNHSDIVSFIGSFVIGVLGNLYSRIFKGTAFTAMVTGVLFLVPSGIAAAGGLAITQQTDDGDSYSNGLLIGFRMIQVAIGITVGLFFASFLIYSFFSGRKRSAVLFAF